MTEKFNYGAQDAPVTGAVPQGDPGTQAALSRPGFSAAPLEHICSWVSYIMAFTYIMWTDLFGNGGDERKLFLALTAALIILMTELLNRGRQRPAENWIWLACFLAPVAGSIAGRDAVWDTEQLGLFIHIFAVWWIISRSGILLDGESGHLLPADALNGFVTVPFGHFFLRIRTVFSSIAALSRRDRPRRRISLWTAAALAVSAYLLIEAAGLLLSADSVFRSRFMLLGEWIQKAADLISSVFNDMFFLRFAFSIPVGCWLYGLIAGSARTGRDLPERQKAGILRFLNSIKKVPSSVWIFATGAFTLLYAAFFILQGSYLFGAFTGHLPEGFIVSQYAREGFFELCRVIAVNFTVLWLVTRMALPQSGNSRALLVCCILLLAESMLFSVIAFSKLFLYIHIFGFTPLRLQSTWLVTVCFAGCVLWTWSLLTGAKTFRKWMIFGAVTLSALCLV